MNAAGGERGGERVSVGWRRLHAEPSRRAQFAVNVTLSKQTVLLFVPENDMNARPMFGSAPFIGVNVCVNVCDWVFSESVTS